MKRMRKRQETCVFLAGVDAKKYGRLKTGLNNAYVAGQNNYPKTVDNAVTMLSHYMHDKGVHMTDADKGQATLTSFMQKHKNVTCYRCGKKGHYANNSPDGDSNDKSYQLDQVKATAATTAGLTALDGVASMMVSHYLKREA
jgi:hypothetical protein